MVIQTLHSYNQPSITFLIECEIIFTHSVAKDTELMLKENAFYRLIN
jgi:hypothetical protein